MSARQTGSGVKDAKRSVMVAVRLTKAERTALRRTARAEGISVSVLLRTLVLSTYVLSHLPKPKGAA